MRQAMGQTHPQSGLVGTPKMVMFQVHVIPQGMAKKYPNDHPNMFQAYPCSQSSSQNSRTYGMCFLHLFATYVQWSKDGTAYTLG